MKKLIYNTTKNWLYYNPFIKSASIAYYFIFSLPSILLILISILQNYFGKDMIVNKIYDYIYSFVGQESANFTRDLISNTAYNPQGFTFFIIGTIVTIISATTIIVQLRDNLLEIWEIESKLDTIRDFFNKRFMSFFWIIILSLIFIIFLIGSTILQIFIQQISLLVNIFNPFIITFINNFITFIIISLILGTMYKVLSLDKFNWKQSILGGVVTAILSLIGKYVLEFYFANFAGTSIYGASSSILVILLWVNYMSLILFWGANFTKELYREKILS